MVTVSTTALPTVYEQLSISNYLRTSNRSSYTSGVAYHRGNDHPSIAAAPGLILDLALLSQWTVSIEREQTYLVQSRGPQIQLQLCQANTTKGLFIPMNRTLPSIAQAINITLFLFQAEMLNMYTENREWKIKGKLGVAKRDMKYSCCEEHYPGKLHSATFFHSESQLFFTIVSSTAIMADKMPQGYVVFYRTNLKNRLYRIECLSRVD